MPIVIPLVVHHGEENWTAESKLSSLLECKDANLLRYVPDFEYILRDISIYPDEQITGVAALKVMLLLLK